MKNAIERRLERLHDQWVEFSLLPEPRVLRWLIRSDEYRMIEAFLQKEGDDAAGELPDLFLRFAEPFEDVNTYGSALLESLTAQYAVAREELESEGLPASWEPPPVPPGTHSLTSFLAAARSLQEHYGAEMEQLVLVLTPTDVDDLRQWQRWILAAVHGLPPTIRVIVLDDADAPTLEALVAEGGQLVHSTTADLTMPEAMVELARAGGTGTPGGQFRVQFAALGQALSKGDQAAAERAGGAALAIAEKSGWTHLTGAVHFALASGLLSAGRTLEAVERYRRVDAVGTKLEQEGDAVGTKLRMQSAFAAGAVYLSAGSWAEAVQSYQRAASLAQAVGEPLMVLDAWRMTSYCQEQFGDIPRAWDTGQKALDAAEAIPSDQRAYSMLPYTGQAMLRMASSSPSHTEAVHKRMAALMGTRGWLPRPPGGPG